MDRIIERAEAMMDFPTDEEMERVARISHIISNAALRTLEEEFGMELDPDSTDWCAMEHFILATMQLNDLNNQDEE